MTYDQAIKFTSAGDHPLALYPFTESQAEKDRITTETLSGGVTFNDCAMHAFAKGAPFGGTGNSGTGSYHGPYGILTFSHLRTYVNGLPSWMEGLMGARYPPYSDKKTKKQLELKANKEQQLNIPLDDTNEEQALRIGRDFEKFGGGEEC